MVTKMDKNSNLRLRAVLSDLWLVHSHGIGGGHGTKCVSITGRPGNSAQKLSTLCRRGEEVKM